MLVCSVQIISVLGNQSIVPIPGNHIGVPKPEEHQHGGSLLVSANLHINIFMHLLKLGELSSLFLFYNITISRFIPLNSFLFYFLLRDNENTALGIVENNRLKFDLGN